MGTGAAVIVTVSWRRCMLWFDLDLCLFGMFIGSGRIGFFGILLDDCVSLPCAITVTVNVLSVDIVVAGMG